jgi:hypothetical protein
MSVQTLGEAWKLGWRIRARCFWTAPNKNGKRIVPWCDTTVQLDMVTLIWTRGEMFPLEQLSDRLRCPKCGKLGVRVFFEPPNSSRPQAMGL